MTKLGSMTVLDADRRAVLLADLWKDRPAVLLFVRHFGCLLCREHTARVQARLAEIHAAGAEVYVIGNGAPTFIEGFREATGWTGAVYTDPSLEVYKAAGLRRGVFTVIHPRAAIAALGALRGGFKQGATQGDQLQQGGVVVVAPSGEVVWAHVSEYAGDNADPDAIVAALRRTAAA